MPGRWASVFLLLSTWLSLPGCLKSPQIIFWGLDTKETVDISLLKAEEKEMIYALIEYFHKSNTAFQMLNRLGYVSFDDEAFESL